MSARLNLKINTYSRFHFPNLVLSPMAGLVEISVGDIGLVPFNTDKRTLPPRHVIRRPQLYTDPQKSDEWLARRTEQTASQAGANVGLSPYRDAFPEHRYLEIAGIVANDFQGNEHTRYGERYEDRIRHIQQVVFSIVVIESGCYRSWLHRFQSCSLDGESNAIRIRGLLDNGERVDWALGKILCEDKASKLHFYETPRIPHIAQLQYQMMIMGRWYGILHYWHRDCTRIWLMRYDPQFCLWMQRRLALLHEHVARKVPVLRSNPYFNHRAIPGQRHWPGCTVADWMAREWFTCDGHTGRALRPRITVAEWLDELALLGMSEEQWAAAYPELVPRISMRNRQKVCLDAGNLATPPRPQIFLVYEHRRDVPDEEVEGGDACYVTDQDDPAWFHRNFPHVTEWAAEQIRLTNLGRRPHRPNERMTRLYINEVLPMPEADEPEPGDEAHLDSMAESLEFQRRLANLKARKPAARQATLDEFLRVAHAPDPSPSGETTNPLWDAD